MGEHHSNPKSLIKEELGVGKEDDQSVRELNDGSLVLVTELARIGHTYLKSAVPDMKANIDKGHSAITQEQYEHFKSLYEVGFEVLAHFDAMCEYLHAQSEKADEKVEGEK